MYQGIMDAKMAHNAMKEQRSHLLHPKGVIRPHVASNKSNPFVNLATMETMA